MTQLDGSAIPGQAAPVGPPPPAQPPAPPAQPPMGGADYAAYAPTAVGGFPAQTPPPGAPIGPYDPVPGGGYATPDASQGYGYDYQQQAGYTYPGVPVPAAPKQRNPVMLWGGIIGGVLAIAIVIGLVVLLQPSPKPNPNPGPVADSGGTSTSTSAGGTRGTTGSTTPDSSNATYKIAWNTDKDPNADSSSQLLGVWGSTSGSDSFAVRADTTGIRAYNLADGKQAWNVPVPSGSKELCTASRSRNAKNIIAVSFNTGDYDCSTIGAVDIAQGKLLWSVKATPDKLSNPALSVTDKVVAVGSLGALNIDNGQSVWQFKGRGKDCSVYGAAAGSVIAASDRCYDTGLQKSVLQVVNAETGNPVSQAIPLNGQIERIDAVISTQPLVVLMSGGTNGDYILPFDDSYKPGNPMSTKEAGSDSLRLSGQSDPVSNNVVVGKTLYVQIDGGKSGINAYDLGTGKRLWAVSAPSSSDDMRLVPGTTKEGKVRAIVGQGYDKPAKLVALSPNDGSMSDIGTMSMPNGLDIGMSMVQYFIPDDNSQVIAYRRNSGYAPPLTKWSK
ncbi:outer membrane protein assembly factor BamB family protein [Kitasatospora cathayae]|uniref:PQQ-binding-like beta-propeller repeat protein n=1 Tax=Kitasatospora cathayae TaxID=3004092 RepID=A0ABY7Q335_9ACTN|nr:PQQ-binding-like beta-propeller repeat protein [Kitasatospora sp. HUAS 3-15]WBP86601.1 PQQ-binding-like beta-propeller repeat protein [Kitasatospora sp. HUAS 3-15]